MSEGCTTSLSRPRWLLGLSAQRYVVLLCVNDAPKPLTFKSFLMYSNHVFLGRTLGLLSVKLSCPPFLAMCLDPYVEYDCTNEEAHVSLHFIYYADPVDF